MDADDASSKPPTPMRRRNLIIGAVALAIVLVAGFLVGQWLLRAPETTLIAPGTLIEIRSSNGSVLLGTYVGTDDDYLILASPTSLSEPDEESGAVELRSLAADPWAIGGNILVERGQILYIGGVTADSDLFGAYQQATEGGAAPVEPDPSPAPS